MFGRVHMLLFLLNLAGCVQKVGVEGWEVLCSFQTDILLEVYKIVIRKIVIFSLILFCQQQIQIQIP